MYGVHGCTVDQYPCPICHPGWTMEEINRYVSNFGVYPPKKGSNRAITDDDVDAIVGRLLEVLAERAPV